MAPAQQFVHNVTRQVRRFVAAYGYLHRSVRRGMRVLECFAHLAVRQVRVDLCGGDASMTEQLLDMRSGAPPWSRCVAKLCRSVWGVSFRSIPARADAFLSTNQYPWRVIG